MKQTNRKRQIAFIISILLLVALFQATAFQDAATAAQEPTTAVHLKSRTFTPQRGPDGALQATPPSGRWHGLIQLEAIPDAAQRRYLAEAGVELLAYVPDNNWLAALPANLQAIDDLEGVRWFGPLEPADKIAPALTSGAAAEWALGDDGRLALVVDMFADVEPATIAGRIMALGGELLATEAAGRQLPVSLPAGALWELAAEDGIQWIGAIEPPKSTSNEQVRETVSAEPVQGAPYELDGSGVQAAMWDDGHVDSGHPDFTGRLTRIGSYSVASHATHVAGTMGGDGRNSIAHGGSPYQWRGIAPGADILSYNWSNLINAHDDAINNRGADLSQNSWGYSFCSITGQYDYNAPQYDDIVNGLWGRRIPVVFAAGNMRSSCSGSYGTIQGGPPSAKNVLAVGAVYKDSDSMAAFSSFGPTLDGRLKPELVAPGTAVAGGIHSAVAGGAYGGYAGTSMAAPAVSGALALLLERYHDICPGSGDGDGNPLPSTGRAVLLHSADDLNDGITTQPGPDYASGYGRLNVQQAIDLLPHHLEGSLEHGGLDNYTLYVAQQETLKVTLAWDDVPGVAAAGVALVNDLNLELVGPDGTVHYPWLLDPANPAAAAVRGVDDRNVVEQVVVEQPLAGTWTIRVKGHNVPQGTQHYSLVSDWLTESSCQGPATEVWLDDGGSIAATPQAPNSFPPPWESNDIWVRHEPDPDGQYLHQHQNPEHGQTNYLHVMVHNDGQEVAHTVQVLAYWADQAEGAAAWSEDWELAGAATVINIAPGSEQVAVIEWYPPQPVDRINGQLFSLYVRLVAMQDPFVEGSDATANVANNDDIAGKNVTVVDIHPNEGEIPTVVALSQMGILPALHLRSLYAAVFGLLAMATVLSHLIIHHSLRPSVDTSCRSQKKAPSS